MVFLITNPIICAILRIMYWVLHLELTVFLQKAKARQNHELLRKWFVTGNSVCFASL